MNTAADYARWAEDALSMSWDAGDSHEFRALAAARAQVYATLALTAATLEVKEEEKK